MSTTQSGEIDSTLLERLGRVCVRWSVIEALMGALLTFVLGASRSHMHVITQNVSNATVTDWLRVLCDARFVDEPTKKGLKELFRIIDETRGERNSLVHGLWCPGAEPQTALVNTLRMDRAELLKDELVTVADLDDLLNQIGKIDAELTHIGKHLGFFP